MREALFVTIPIELSGNRLDVPLQAEHLAAAKQLANAFAVEQAGLTCTSIEALANFVLFCSIRNSDVAISSFKHLHATFCSKDNIHCVVQQHNLSTEQSRAVLKGYYSVWALLESCQQLPDVRLPALFSSSAAKAVAQFGGQSGVPNYVDEATWIFDVYRPLLVDFVEHMSAFINEESKGPCLAGALEQPLDFIGWILKPDTRPDARQLHAAPISFPFIGLIQFMQLVVLYKTLRIEPGELTTFFGGVIGHSLGIYVATAFASVTDQESFIDCAEKALGLLLAVGSKIQASVPLSVAPRVTADNALGYDGHPSPMAAFSMQSQVTLQQFIDDFNQATDSAESHVTLGLINGHSTFIVSGITESVVMFAKYVRQKCTPEGSDQTSIPFPLRKPEVQITYLDTTVPCHCGLLRSAADETYDYAAAKGWVFDSAKIGISVSSGTDGLDLRNSADLTRSLIEGICTLQVIWPAVIANTDATHIVDFSPGRISPFAMLTHSLVQGKGTAVIPGSSLITDLHGQVGSRADLYQHDISSVFSAATWVDQFGPNLVVTSRRSQIQIDTPMARVLGTPPVMVSAMSPTTVSPSFVATVCNAGYHTELATAGINTELQLRSKVDDILCLLSPGKTFGIQCDFANQQKWDALYPVVLRMCQDGIPISSLSITGHIPPLDIATSIISELDGAGVRQVSFKPLTVADIHAVAAVAAANSHMSVLLQWSGGRSGGQHSWEDFYQPILEVYGQIRSCKNIVLVASSGCGDSESALPFITGEWSHKFGRPSMPFDGIALGSCVMVAKEAATSPAAKELIIATPGVDDRDWTATHHSAAGGVVSINSYEGTPIHVLATRAALFVRYMQDTVFSLPAERQISALKTSRAAIIRRLNSDYMKPWFGTKADGSVVEVEDMTYSEVVSRLTELMFIHDQCRWIDLSLRDVMASFLELIENRFSQKGDLRILNSKDEIATSLLPIQVIEETYPEMKEQLLTAEDTKLFMSLCKQPRQRSVPFVPSIDSDLHYWMLNDIMWQVEDLEAVPNCDVQRVIIKQGPVSVKHARSVDEPIKDILDRIHNNLIDSLLQRQYSGDASLIPAVEYLGPEPSTFVILPSITVTTRDAKRVYTFTDGMNSLPDISEWVEVLAGPKKSWLRALLVSPTVTQGTALAPNAIQRVLRPRVGQTISITEDGGIITSVEIVGSNGKPDVNITFGSNSIIRVELHHYIDERVHDLVLLYQYSPDTPAHLIVEVMDGRDERLCSQFFHVHQEEAGEAEKVTLDESNPQIVLMTRPRVLSLEMSQKFCRAVGNNMARYTPRSGYCAEVPIDILFNIAWPKIVSILSAPPYHADMLNLLHLSNKVEMLGNSILHVGDSVEAAVQLASVYNSKIGRKMEFASKFYHAGQHIATVYTDTLIRKNSVLPHHQFRSVKEETYRCGFRSASEIAVLDSKSWFIRKETVPNKIIPGSILEFELKSFYRYRTEAIYSHVLCTGPVYLLLQNGRRTLIAHVDYQNIDVAGNSVVEYLEKNFGSFNDSFIFDTSGHILTPLGDESGMSVIAAAENLTYANASGDYNPIHTNPYVADYIGLPATIAHGMWTSASSRALIEKYAAGNALGRVRSFETEFRRMVLPGDSLITKLRHIGMKHGHMLIRGETSNQDGTVIMKSLAEVEQPKIAYTFTGLGSQEKGMGMDLYNSSSAARAVWDRAESHIKTKYGVSLLEIVQKNPTKLVVKFGGPEGERVKQNYLSFTRDIDDKTQPLFPSITTGSFSYTQYRAGGLLHAAIFAQPAIVVNQLAQIADLRSKSLIASDIMIAGHSLGEFGALAALADIATVEGIVDILIYRGLLLHTSVPRDTQGHSEYSMVAVNPSRINHGFNEKLLSSIVDCIRGESTKLLEVINYNVGGQQYVITGHNDSLKILKATLDHLASNSADMCSILEPMKLQQIVSRISRESTKAISLQDGAAFKVLANIDVPSHSTQLVPSVATFRRILQQNIPKGHLDYSKLHGRYIPNILGTPFTVSREYFEQVHDITKSSVIARHLESWDETRWASDLAHELLIELLAYQFASPVHWIKSQHTLIKHCKVQQIIEVGSLPVLSKMFEQTLSKDEFCCHQVTVLHTLRDRERVYFEFEPEMPVAETAEEPANSHQPNEIEQAPIPLPAAPIQVSAPAKPTAIPDHPLKLVHVIKAIVTQKLKRSWDEIDDFRSIKELVVGKSMMQNEIIGDLQKEIDRQLPDRSEDMPLQELAKTIGVFSGKLGRYSHTLISKMFNTKIPTGFAQSVVRTYLQSAYGLGPHHQDAFLLVAATMEPASRLASDESAKSWVDDIAGIYAKIAGITYTAPGGSLASSSSGVPMAVVDNAEFANMKLGQRTLVQQQMEVFAKTLGIDLRQGDRKSEELRAEFTDLNTKLNRITAELGEGLVDGTAQMFDVRKARHYDSCWNWARHDALELIYRHVIGTVIDDDAYAQKLHMLKNRASPSLLLLLESLVSELNVCGGPDTQDALKMTTEVYSACKQAQHSPPVYMCLSRPTRPNTEIARNGDIVVTEVPRENESSMAEYVRNARYPFKGGLPPLFIYERAENSWWDYSEELTNQFMDGLEDIARDGISFEGKTALVTGCNRGSIGAQLVEALLSGGAKVVATTSSYGPKSIRHFEDIYRKFGARGSELVVLPFNQASTLDIKSLVKYIYSDTGLGWDLDFFAPYAAFPERGKDMQHLDTFSDLSMRILLLNTERMIGEISSCKEKRGYTLSPTVVMLPHSANRGIMGNDGVYGEAKYALHSLYNKWESESWSRYISLTGADMGWTRNTGFTTGNAFVFQDVEEKYTRTFTRDEMVLNTIGLLTPQMTEISHKMPIFGNFGGGQDVAAGKMSWFFELHNSLTNTSVSRKAVHSGHSADYAVERPLEMGYIKKNNTTSPTGNHIVRFPQVKSYNQLAHLHYLQGMANLDKVVVVTGFGEVGPFGNSSLRWEMEAFGEFSFEGCIELAWIMGLIKRSEQTGKTSGDVYIGWVDAKTGEPVHDMDIKARYEEYILKHTGIRVIEPEIHDGYEPDKKPLLRELQIDHDMNPFETSADEAFNFKRGNGDKVDIWENADGSWSVRFLKGAVLLIPKAVRFDRHVASQLPTGWDPVRYGIPKDIADTVDLITCYGIVAATEALVKSGITDPYELFQYFHLSEVGSAIGTTYGGTRRLRDMFKNRFMEKPIPVETDPEAMGHMVNSWINMLLLSASGPMKAHIGACATAAFAFDTAVEMIQTGKARVMLAGAGDGFVEEASSEYAKVSATSNSADDVLNGRAPEEMCRPCTTTRNGFMEGYGSGVLTLMSASAALEFGAPVYGIIAYSTSAMDKESRNQISPGQGLVTAAREVGHTGRIPLLDFEYRRMMLNKQLLSIEEWKKHEASMLNSSLKKPAESDPQNISEELEYLEDEARRQRNEALDTWSNEFWKRNAKISPLRGSLAMWGLGANDIDFVSFHATSTQANDRNESEIINTQLQHLGRRPGLPVPVVCQKWLTGHPKAPAAAWIMNGVLQIMETGIIPGNRNADNIDKEFERFEHLVYLQRSIKAPATRAALLTSFGYGQAGGQLLVLHPDYFLATLSKEQLEEYQPRVLARKHKAYRYWQDSIVGNNTFVRVKHRPPYTAEQEHSVLLNPLARAKLDPVSNEYVF